MPHRHLTAFVLAGLPVLMGLAGCPSGPVVVVPAAPGTSAAQPATKPDATATTPKAFDPTAAQADAGLFNVSMPQILPDQATTSIQVTPRGNQVVFGLEQGKAPEGLKAVAYVITRDYTDGTFLHLESGEGVHNFEVSVPVKRFYFGKYTIKAFPARGQAAFSSLRFSIPDLAPPTRIAL